MRISLRDPLWQFIAVIVGILSIAIVIIIYYSQRQYKELSYEIISNSPLLTKSKEIEGNVQIIFDNKPVNNVYLLVLKIINSGNIPISKKDYESPITFYFADNNNILLADVAKSEPKSLKVNLNKIENKVIIDPLLLNAGDSITLKFLLSEFSGDIKPEFRIYGIKAINKVTRQSDFYGKTISFILGVFSFIIFAKLFPFIINKIEELIFSKLK